MKYSVVLQAPYDFEAAWPLIGGALLLASVALWLGVRALLKYLDRPRDERIGLFQAIRRFLWKRRSIGGLKRIEKRFRRRELDSRAAYRLISGEVRRFVGLMTRRPAGHMTLSELQGMKCAPLTGLMEELYELEFARTPRPEIHTTIQKSKELIRKWH